MKKAIFPGSFDPFTIGHYDIVMRGLDIFDHIVIAVGINCQKKTLFSEQQRIELIKKAFENENRVTVISYDTLTVDAAKANDASFILRGIRSSIDLEYERPIADINKSLSGIETLFLLAAPQHSSVSSTIVRDLISHGKDVTPFLPPNSSI